MHDQSKAVVLPFTYDDETTIRTVLIDGDPWFVLTDLCAALDIANSRNVSARLDHTTINTVRLADGNRGNPNVTVVNEAGMYEVVFRSDKPDAVAFRRWVTGTVLPQIRKTGTYSAQPALSPIEKMAQGLMAAQEIIEQKDAHIAQLETKAETDAPKVTYVDTYVTDADLLTFSFVASSHNVKESWLREFLIEKNWIYVQTDSHWSSTQGKKVNRNRYSEKADKKRYFRRVPNHEAPRFRGYEVMHTLKITPQGAEAIARLLAKDAAA